MATTQEIRPALDWRPAGEWTDIRYEVAEGIAKITIDRPEVRNAFRPLTTKELIAAFEMARDDPAIGVVILTGEGPDAFSSGGDQKIRGDDGYVADQGIGRLNVLDLQIQIRRFPKPVIAMVAGYAIGGGHVLHLCCDLTIAAENARVGRTGARGGGVGGGGGGGVRVFRWRVACQPARRADRREAPQGGVVPLPPVRRADRARLGAGQHRRAVGAARTRDRVVVPRDAADESAGPAPAEGGVERADGRAGRRAAARR